MTNSEGAKARSTAQETSDRDISDLIQDLQRLHIQQAALLQALIERTDAPDLAAYTLFEIP